MIIKIPFKPKTILVLLVTALIFVASSFFFFKKLENIVHSELYSYGLISNYEWVNAYWANSHSYLYVLELAILLFGIAIAFFLFHMRNRNILSSHICSLLLAVGAGLNIFSIYLCSRLDYIVNHDLYFYGLTFSDEWFSDYSLSYQIMVWLIAFAGVLAIIMSAVIYLSARKKIRVVPARLVDSTLIAVGTVTLSLSIIYASSSLTLIGLGLLFFGVTFTYVRTEEYIKKILLDTTASYQLVTLNQVIEELEFTGYAVYLPPQYFRKPNTYKAYIPKDKLAMVPTPEQMHREEPAFFIEFLENPPAVLMTPPGAELVQLFERMLKTNFFKVDLLFLQQNLPKLLIEDLELASFFEILFKDENVRIRIEDSVYSFQNMETDQPSIFSSFGSPLSSAVACVLAKVSGKPVIRVSPRTGLEGRSVIVEYRILGYGSKQDS